jgi:hypothetical protein
LQKSKSFILSQQTKEQEKYSNLSLGYGREGVLLAWARAIKDWMMAVTRSPHQVHCFSGTYGYFVIGRFLVSGLLCPL